MDVENQNPEDMMKNIMGMVEKVTESENAINQERLTVMQKNLTQPKKKYYKIEGYFNAVQMEELSKFLKGDIFNE